MSQESKDLFEKSATRAKKAYVAMASRREVELPKDLMDKINAAKKGNKPLPRELLDRFAEASETARPPVMQLADAVSGPYEAIILSELPKFYGVCMVSRAVGQDPIIQGMQDHELLNAIMINYAELELGTKLLGMDLSDLNRVVDQMFDIIELIKP